MSLINKFCKTNEIKRKKIIILFNHLNKILKSKKDSVLFINMLIKDIILSGTTKKHINVLISILNKTLIKDWFNYKTFLIICEICPFFGLNISRLLGLSISDAKKILVENEMRNESLFNLMFRQLKDDCMVDYMING